ASNNPTDGAPTSVTQHTYFPDGRAFQTINPDGTVQTYDYNAYASETMITDENGNETLYGFDTQGNTVRVTAPDRTSVLSTYSNNLPHSHTDAFGVTTTYTYDSLGNVLTAAETVGSTPVTAMEPNSSGTLVPVALTTTYTYDTLTDGSGNL